MADKKKHAKNLGVPEDAGTRQIRRAFRKQALMRHPDKNDGSVEAKQDFQKLHDSYQTLLKTAVSGKAEIPNRPPSATPPPEEKQAQQQQQPKQPQPAPQPPRTAVTAVPQDKNIPWPIAVGGAVALLLLLFFSFAPEKKQQQQQATQQVPEPIKDVPFVATAPEAPPAPLVVAAEPARAPAATTAPEIRRNPLNFTLTSEQIITCVSRTEFKLENNSFVNSGRVEKSGCILRFTKFGGGEVEMNVVDICNPLIKISVQKGSNRDISADTGCFDESSEFAKRRKELNSLWAGTANSHEIPPVTGSTKLALACGDYLLSEYLGQCRHQTPMRSPATAAAAATQAVPANYSIETAAPLKPCPTAAQQIEALKTADAYDCKAKGPLHFICRMKGNTKNFYDTRITSTAPSCDFEMGIMQ